MEPGMLLQRMCFTTELYTFFKTTVCQVVAYTTEMNWGCPRAQENFHFRHIWLRKMSWWVVMKKLHAYIRFFSPVDGCIVASGQLQYRAAEKERWRTTFILVNLITLVQVANGLPSA